MRSLLISIVLLCLSAELVNAQYSSFGLTDARQLGMGNTYASNSRGLYAAGKNPSLLAWSGYNRKLDILFPNLSAQAYNINKTLRFVNDYFSQKPLDMISGIDGSAIGKALANNGKLYIGLQIGYLAAGVTPNHKIGSFSLAMKDYLSAYLKLPEGLIAYNDGKRHVSEVGLRDFEFSGYWTRAYELSYGRMFRTDPASGFTAVYGGIGLKYLTGFSYHQITFSAGVGYEDEDGILTGSYEAISVSAYSDDLNYSSLFKGGETVSRVPFMRPAGRGFGLDAGIALMIDPGLRVGVSVTDAGFIDWKGKTKKMLVSGIVKIDSTLTMKDIDSLAHRITIEKKSYNHFRTNLPYAVHIGFSFMMQRFIRNFPGEMDMTIEMHQGLAESMQNPDRLRLALGIDWKPGVKWPVFMTGITNSLQQNAAWSVGIGYELKFLEFYISSPNVIPLLEGTDLQTLSLSLCWHFVNQ